MTAPSPPPSPLPPLLPPSPPLLPPSPPPSPLPLSEGLDPPQLGTNSRWAFVVCCLLFTVCLKRDSLFTVLAKICKVYRKIEQRSPEPYRTRSRIRLESFEFPASLWLANTFWPIRSRELKCFWNFVTKSK